MGDADRTLPRVGGPADGGPGAADSVDPDGLTLDTGDGDGGSVAAAPELVAAGRRYRTGAEIARGGMGRVVEARDTVLGRVVAVKEALTTDPATLQRFLRETRITARLEHPAIVPIYDAGVMDDGSPYYVMRKVSGQPLERLVLEKAALGERLALVQNVVAAAQAVAHAHQRGVLHRDLKPANILVGELGETVVIDWGLAKVVDELDDHPPGPGDPANRPSRPIRPIELSGQHVVETRAGAVFGTPGFMSPEQLSGYGVDARSDVYALGATLYFVLARKAPHHGGGADVMMARAAAGPPEPIAELVPGVPRDLAAIVDTALAFDRERRYPDAGALAMDLQRFLTGQLVKSRRYSRGERFVRLVRRNRVPAVVVVVAVIAGAIAVSRVIEERARTRDALAVALHEQQQASEALEEMRLNQARALLASNPTAALAVARPLAGTPRWREVRAIAAAARTGGACVGIPGPLSAMAVILAPGGLRAASVDTDGSVWLHELVGRSSRQLVRLALRHTKVAFAGDDRVVAYDHDTLAVFDVATGARRDLAHRGPIAHASATATELFVVAETGGVQQIDLATGASRDLDVPGAIEAAPSPDGRTLAVGTIDGLVVVELARAAEPGAAPPVRLGKGRTWFLRWDARGTGLAMFQRDDAVLMTMQPVPALTERRATGVVLGAGAAEGHLYVLDRDGLRLVSAGAPILFYSAISSVGMSFTRGEAPVVGHRNGSITIVTPYHTIELRAPSDDVARVAASPNSRFVVAAIPGRLLVWDVDVLIPRIEDVGEANLIATAGGREILLGAVSGDWRWRDLDTDAETRFRVPMGLYVTYTNERGDPLALVPMQSDEHRRVVAVFRDPPKSVPIEGDVSTVWVQTDRITVGTADGRVLDLGLGPRTVTPVISRSSPVVSVSAGGAWRSARWTDGTLWRRHADGREQTARLAVERTAAMPIHQLADGRVFTASGARLVCWNLDGTLTTLATLPGVVFATELVGDQIIVSLLDRSIHRVALATGRIRSVTASGGVALEISEATGLGVTTMPDGRLLMIDLIANASWSLAGGFNSSKSMAQLTRDGRHVAVVIGVGRLLTWKIELPDGPEATARWLDQISNASADNGPTQLTWR